VEASPSSRGISSASLDVMAAAALVLLLAGPVDGQQTLRVSLDSSGVEANDQSFYTAISANGQVVAFSSYATNLVAGDTNGTADIFVHDRLTGITERVSVDSSGAEGNYQITPPEAVLGGTSSTFLYTILLRAANVATSNRTVTFSVTPAAGGTPVIDSVTIPPTGDPNEYVVVSTDPNAPISMQSGIVYRVRLTLGGDSCSLDDFVVKSGGVVQ
jgi:hypothetical protein